MKYKRLNYRHYVGHQTKIANVILLIVFCDVIRLYCTYLSYVMKLYSISYLDLYYSTAIVYAL